MRYFVYALSGRGIIPGKSRSLVKLLKEVGVVFPPVSKYNNRKGELIFEPAQEIGQETMARALDKLRSQGISGAKISLRGNYIGTKG